MGRIYKAVIIVFFLLLTIPGVISCTGEKSAVQRPAADNGFIDIHSIDFTGGETVKLRGNWKFIWLRDDPAFADPGFNDSDWKTITVPGYWDRLTGTGNGYGWYRLRVRIDGDKLRASGERLALSADLIQSACEIYVNGAMLMSSGTFGTDTASSIPQIHPRLEAFDPPSSGDIITVAVRNSNFSHRSGGPYSVPELGLNRALSQRLWYSDVARLVALGIILMMAIYHGILWYFRREDRASLYFCLGCAVILFRLIATSGYLERLFPGRPMYETHFTIVYASIPLGWITFAFFFRELFREEFSGRLFAVFTALGALFTAAAFFLPCRVYSPYSILFEGSLIVVGVWFMAGIITAAVRKRPGAIYILPGFIAFFITGFNDILAVKLIIGTPEVAPVGLVIMIFFQSAVLSGRFAQAFRTAEHLSLNLSAEVTKKTDELQEQMDTALRAQQETERSRAELDDAYQRLNAVYTIIKNDLDVAKNIQQTLFPTSSGGILGLRYSARYIPLIEVGGDIYDICPVDDRTARFFIADATGHGIHASLTTMLIKGEYDMLKVGSLTPLEIVTELNNKFYRHYRPIAKYFTSFLIDINPSAGTVAYVSSGHPAQYLIRGRSIIELATTGRAMGFTEHTNCVMGEAEFRSGDRLLFFTDGLYEQFNARRELFGEERIKKIIMENSGRPMAEIMDRVINIINDHTGNDLNDDIIMIGVERDGEDFTARPVHRARGHVSLRDD
ncbi:MAG: SpoIIE family protein phosphatase [Spirochaetes bacterium]|nr:SpoIIE family protein phosphatase [Spirochaetota bacterium]